MIQRLATSSLSSLGVAGSEWRSSLSHTAEPRINSLDNYLQHGCRNHAAVILLSKNENTGGVFLQPYEFLNSGQLSVPVSGCGTMTQTEFPAATAWTSLNPSPNPCINARNKTSWPTAHPILAAGV